MRGAPRIVIFDPGRYIRNRSLQLDPFDRFVEIYYEIEDLVDQIQNAENEQLFLLLIFPDKQDIYVKCFLETYVQDKTHIFSLFLIFSNGTQCHEQWMNDRTIQKLRWCRSFTTKLNRDIINVCMLACTEHINFYQQRKRQEEDAMECNSIVAADSLIVLYSNTVKEFANLLSICLTKLSESDD